MLQPRTWGGHVVWEAARREQHSPGTFLARLDVVCRGKLARRGQTLT